MPRNYTIVRTQVSVVYLTVAAKCPADAEKAAREGNAREVSNRYAALGPFQYVCVPTPPGFELCSTKEETS